MVLMIGVPVDEAYVPAVATGARAERLFRSPELFEVATNPSTGAPITSLYLPLCPMVLMIGVPYNET